MTIYISLIFVIVLLLFFSARSVSSIYYYFAALILLLFSGLRVNVGMDYETYDDMFSLIRMGMAPFDFEPFNILIVKLVDLFGAGNAAIFFIYSLIILLGVLRFIKRFSASKELSLFLFLSFGFFYLSTMNGIRQWAAISMTLLALVSYIDRRYAQTILWLIMAVMFHHSAIVFIILPLLARRWRIREVVLIASICFFLSDAAIIIVGNSKYSIYIEAIKIEAEFSLFYLIGYLTYLLLSIFILGYFRRSVRLDVGMVIMLNMNLFSLFIMLIGWLAGFGFPMVLRLNSYYTMQMVVLLPAIADKIKKEHVKMGVHILLGVCSIALYLNTLFANGVSHHLLPYHSLFNL